LFGNNKRKRFEILFQPHLDAAYNLARYLCRNDYDAEDIVQEAYLRAFRAFDEYTDDNSRAWILRITRNTCYSWMRRQPTETTIVFDEENHSAASDEEKDGAAALQPLEKIIANDQSQQLIRQAIDSLPAEFREVTILRELEGMSYLEIAGIVGIPKGTVMSRLARARKRLSQLLMSLNEQE
jgi:RNA polymerase sigma-70 factor (ECF subfamily)